MPTNVTENTTIGITPRIPIAWVSKLAMQYTGNDADASIKTRASHVVQNIIAKHLGETTPSATVRNATKPTREQRRARAKQRRTERNDMVKRAFAALKNATK